MCNAIATTKALIARLTMEVRQLLGVGAAMATTAAHRVVPSALGPWAITMRSLLCSLLGIALSPR
jgi:hypothetical protein